MKKYIILALAMMAAVSLNAEEPTYNQKLDSVVGSNDFDWTRWKNIYTYFEDEISFVREEVHYVWENQTWEPSVKTVYRYDIANRQQIRDILVYNANDSVPEGWVEASYTVYEYDELDRETLLMTYVGKDSLEQWLENSKYEYIYNSEGLLDTCLYSTIRNGSWRESQRSIYSYDEDQQCINLLFQRKGGGWGPFGNNWMDSYRYEFEYEDGALAAEYCYVATGWFGGGEMSLDSKWEYEYDANGNLLRKTGSVFNEVDWIVRDVYENQFDATVDASKVKGLEQFWQSIVKEGMGYTMGAFMPLKNQWVSCSIVSSELDTEFTLYCSGFAGVEETEESPLKAWCNNGRLLVVCDQVDDINVFDLLGRVVASESQAQQCEFNVTPGLYIVASGNARVKVIVK